MVKIRRVLSIVLLGASLTLPSGPGVAALPPQTPEPPDEPLSRSDGSSEEYLFDLKEVVSRSMATISPQGDIIDVATDSDEDEWYPAVALCAFDQYLVVYENETDDEIYGQRLDSDGDLLGGAFQITGDAFREARPDVACEWAYNRFIVVWEHDSANSGDFDVRVQGVYGSHQTSGSQLYGTWHAVSEDAPEDELDPAIACNSSRSCSVNSPSSLLITSMAPIVRPRLVSGVQRMAREVMPASSSTSAKK